jgi:hypothetical protein
MRSGDPSEREAASRLARVVFVGLTISVIALAILITRAH